MGEVAVRHGDAPPPGPYAVAVGAAGAAQVGHGNVQHNYIQGRRPVAWPHRVGAVPLLADCYQARSVSSLLTAAFPSPHSTPRQVLCGLGGVGKTQLAAAFAEQMWAAGRVDLLLWITAVDREAVEAAYAQAAADLTGIEDARVDRAVARFLAWLSTSGRPWLVVLDDVTSPGHLADLWPPSVPGGVTVVTTRRRDAALAGHGRLVDVDVFSHDEAHTYLMSKLGDRRHLADDVAGLAADLGHLPLALAQAAAYLADRDLPASGYRRRLADARQRLSDLLPEPDALPDAHRATLASTWRLSIGLADQLTPRGLAWPLLVLASMLDPNGIPEAVFTTAAARRYLARARQEGAGPGETVSADEAREGLRCLHRLSLVTINPGSASRSVRIHALVQRATRDQLAGRDIRVAGRAAADALLEAWPPVDHDRGLGQSLRANTAILAAERPDLVWSPACHPVLLRAGRSLGDAGQLPAAVAYWRRMDTEVRARLGADHADALAIRHDLARWQGEAGAAPTAVQALERLLVDVRRVRGPDHPDALATRGTLAYWRGKSGDVAGAAAELADLVADRRRLLGADHQHTLATRCFLAYWRGRAGEAPAAVADLEELLADRLRVFGPDHPDVLSTRHNLAYWRGQAGDAAGAVAALEEVRSDVVRVLGHDHPDALAARHNLAHWRGGAGDAGGAVAALEELVADRLRVVGADHPDVLAARHNLAYWRGRAGDPAAAAAALEALCGHVARVLGADHPDSLATRHDLAHWRGRAGDPAGAAGLLAGLVSDRRRVLGHDHPDTLVTRLSLAHWRGAAGDPAAAVRALEEALPDAARVFGADHRHTRAGRQALGYWRDGVGDAAKVVAALDELLSDRLHALGTDHPADGLANRHNLAYWRQTSPEV
ncbi:tetratricopeptide repeat protein [Phytohabitans sp. LJ34]|uniref:tetratricopeptide repeat protein n=1 Tax=Phytohabitans sp. LJ34 TaxID=3452217 RepID=UPI003F8940F0